MKKTLFSALLVAATLIWGSSALALETSPLGFGNLALKVDNLTFTDNDLEDLDLDDGLYLGVEGYGQIADNTYFGAEFGYFNEDNDTLAGESEVTYMPVELNLKYTSAPGPNIVFGMGGGISYNYAEVENSGIVAGSEDDWLFGGQLFADVNFVFAPFFYGLNAKYQFVEEFDAIGVDMDNWRLGGQVGLKF